jgi:adenine specific DNA methylase Mod
MLKETLEKNEQAKANSREIELLKKDFPQCFDKLGKFDIKILERIIESAEVDVKKEGYTLDFLGKSYGRYLASLDSETVIVPDEQNKEINSENVYIVGDNLDALQHLKYSYTGQIKCIYIDPPYNTGSDGFVYNDKFEFTAEELARKINIEEEEAERILRMQGESTHSAWLTFMYPRLELAKDLLSDDGVIFISIDDNEQANCKLLCDSIFGERNFICCFNWNTKKAAQGMTTEHMIVENHEYILAYGKNNKIVFNGLVRDENNGFSNPDNDPRGLWKRQYLQRIGQGLPVRTITDPKTGISFSFETPYTLEKLNKWISENRIIFPKNADAYPARKEFLNEYANLQQLVTSLGLYATKATTEKLYNLFDGKKIFTNPKPDLLIQFLLQQAMNDNDIVLDFFSGSATTAHAVMQRNVSEQLKCKYIMVQLDEPVKEKSEAEKAGYKTIDEIGRERIRRAGKKLSEEEPEKAKDADLGFKTYYLKATDKNTLDKLIEFNPALPINGEDIKSKYGKETIMETWKIRDGYGFNASYKEVDLCGYTAYLLSDSKVGTTLYLLDDMPEKAIIELVKKLETYELNPNRIIEYGYAFTHCSNTALSSNLITLKNRPSLFPIIRY